MKNKILPLGSVVNLKNGDGTELLIVSRASIVTEKIGEVYYDYGAILIPQGLSSPEAVYFFNRENIDKVIFKGYENLDEQYFSESYDEMIKEAKVPRGEV